MHLMGFHCNGDLNIYYDFINPTENAWTSKAKTILMETIDLYTFYSTYNNDVQGIELVFPW